VLWYRRGVTFFGILMIALGFVLIFRGALEGRAIGLVVGALFVALGAGRIYMLRRG
jgi:uncharacterized membrane protein HdeD (DUF308 family)